MGFPWDIKTLPPPPGLFPRPPRKPAPPRRDPGRMPAWQVAALAVLVVACAALSLAFWWPLFRIVADYYGGG